MDGPVSDALNRDHGARQRLRVLQKAHPSIDKVNDCQTVSSTSVNIIYRKSDCLKRTQEQIHVFHRQVHAVGTINISPTFVCLSSHL